MLVKEDILLNNSWKENTLTNSILEIGNDFDSNVMYHKLFVNPIIKIPAIP
jgi:hypothetical protein